MRDPYSVLGVAKTADGAAIKSAYRKLAKKLHPDQNPDDPKAQERFAEISSAYDVLGDAKKRSAFDRGEIDASGNPSMGGFNPFGAGGRSRAQGGPNPGFEDLFASFSQNRGPGYRSGGFSGGGRASPGAGGGPEDILRAMFSDARTQDHPGGVHGPGTPPRGASKGADVKVNAKVTLEEVLAGEKLHVTLPGQGTVKIALPFGVEDGQTIRLKGKGQASTSPGGTSGDALVTLSFAAHPTFRAEGQTLTMDLPITLDEAVLGARINVATLDGSVALSVPKGAQSGRTMRLKGRGLPAKTGQRGDLLIKVLIKLPDDGDEALEALMLRWRADGRYQVREG